MSLECVNVSEEDSSLMLSQRAKPIDRSSTHLLCPQFWVCSGLGIPYQLHRGSPEEGVMLYAGSRGFDLANERRHDNITCRCVS